LTGQKAIQTEFRRLCREKFVSDHEAFFNFTSESKDFITRTDFKNALIALGMSVSDSDRKKMRQHIDKANRNTTKRITFVDFHAFMGEGQSLRKTTKGIEVTTTDQGRPLKVFVSYTRGESAHAGRQVKAFATWFKQQLQAEDYEVVTAAANKIDLPGQDMSALTEQAADWDAIICLMDNCYWQSSYYTQELRSVYTENQKVFVVLLDNRAYFQDMQLSESESAIHSHLDSSPQLALHSHAPSTFSFPDGRTSAPHMQKLLHQMKDVFLGIQSLATDQQLTKTLTWENLNNGNLASIPDACPEMPPYFQPRGEVMAQLKRLCHRENVDAFGGATRPKFIIVSGVAGSGKSVIASTLLMDEDVLGQYEAVAWVSLTAECSDRAVGMERRVRSALKVQWKQFTGAFMRDDVSQQPLTDQLTSLQNIVAGHRVLVVMDGLTDPATIPLINCAMGDADSTVVLTTRLVDLAKHSDGATLWEGEGVAEVQLEEMASGDASKLLLSAAGYDFEETDGSQGGSNRINPKLLQGLQWMGGWGKKGSARKKAATPELISKAAQLAAVCQNLPLNVALVGRYCAAAGDGWHGEVPGKVFAELSKCQQAGLSVMDGVCAASLAGVPKRVLQDDMASIMRCSCVFPTMRWLPVSVFYLLWACGQEPYNNDKKRGKKALQALINVRALSSASISLSIALHCSPSLSLCIALFTPLPSFTHTLSTPHRSHLRSAV
jgi:hypothetical protein